MRPKLASSGRVYSSLSFSLSLSLRLRLVGPGGRWLGSAPSALPGAAPSDPPPSRPPPLLHSAALPSAAVPHLSPPAGPDLLACLCVHVCTCVCEPCTVCSLTNLPPLLVLILILMFCALALSHSFLHFGQSDKPLATTTRATLLCSYSEREFNK